MLQKHKTEGAAPNEAEPFEMPFPLASTPGLDPPFDSRKGIAIAIQIKESVDNTAVGNNNTNNLQRLAKWLAIAPRRFQGAVSDVNS